MKIFESPGSENPIREKLWRDLQLPIEFVKSAEDAEIVLTNGLDSEERLQNMRNIPREILLLRHVDVIDQRDPKKTWPRSLLTTALKHSVLRKKRSLDLRARALTTGVSPLTRAALLAIFEIGYRKASLVHTQDEAPAAEKIREDFSKFCFGLQIELQKRSELTLAPNNGTLLLNVDDLEKDEDLLQTLLYLNFLHRPGIVVDASVPKATPSLLLKEAALSEFGTVTEIEVHSEWDLLLLEHLQIKPGVDLAGYQERLAAAREA